MILNKIFFRLSSGKEQTFILKNLLNASLHHYVLKNGNKPMFVENQTDKSACCKLATSI